jgi:hypothetical protein
MSPAELNPIREEFEAACKSLGWYRRVVVLEHERDSGGCLREAIWENCERVLLFKEGDLEPGMAHELIRLAEIINE